MSNMLKCPNPSCPYVFDPSQVPVGVVLSCPRCAMQFTLGAPATAAPPSTTAALPPSAPPVPGVPAQPDFTSAGGTATQQRPEPPRERFSEGPPGRRTNKTQVFILATIAAVLMAGTALAIIFKLMRRGESVSSDTVSRLKDLNIGVDTPPPGWTRHDDTRVRVGSPYVLAYKREGPEAYMAFGASEPGKGRAPRPSEMKADLMRAFSAGLQFSKLSIETSGETKWLGEDIAPELGFQFRAESSDGLRWAGEAFAVSHKGFAYYWLSWCQESDFDGLKSEFAAFRGKFKVLDLRKDWKETQSNVIDYKGDKVPYTISDAEEIWREFGIAEEKATDPDLDRLLRARLTPKRDRHALPDEAELRVYVLDGAGDPLEVARKFAEDKEKERVRELNPEFTPPTFEALTDAEQGDPILASVPKSAPVVRLKSKVNESSNAARLIVASGLKVGDKIVVVRCWCEYSKRGVFETKFVQIASSLR